MNDGPDVNVTRVLLFVDNFDYGGSQNQFVALANALEHDPAFEVHVGCLKQRGPLLESLDTPPHRIIEFSLRRFYNARGLWQIGRLARYIARHRIHIIHAQDFYANVICTASTILNSACKLIVSRRYERLSRRVMHRAGEYWCYRIADALLLNSQRIADRLVATNAVAERKTIVIPNGVDLEHFDRDRFHAHPRMLRGHSYRIGLVGTLRPAKGHDVLLAAVSRLNREWPDLEVVLVGDGELRDRIQAQAIRLGIRHRIRFADAWRDVRPWLCSFDVAVLCSHREGLPNALLEYLAMECPVVATRVGAIPEVVEHGREALLVDPGDSAALAAAIRELLSNTQLRARLAAAGRKRAEEYSTHTMTESVRALYRHLLHAQPKSTTPISAARIESDNDRRRMASLAAGPISP